MARIVFEEVAINCEKSGRCGCDKRRTRRKRFWQTINPFNRNARGFPKTREEIYAELREEADAWRGEPITCAACENKT